jgi:hypothetical protein
LELVFFMSKSNYSFSYLFLFLNLHIVFFGSGARVWTQSFELAKRCSTTWVTPPAHFLWLFWRWGLLNYLLTGIELRSSQYQPPKKIGLQAWMSVDAGLLRNGIWYWGCRSINCWFKRLFFSHNAFVKKKFRRIKDLKISPR